VKVIGIAESKGEYEGSIYHNVNFQCTVPYEDGKGTGLQAKSVKVKYKVLTECYGKPLTDKEIVAFVGKEVNFYYDEYKNVSVVQVQNS
jgi:hypothetical protein